MNNKHNKITADYDNSADVMYFSTGCHSPDHYEEDADGLVWRYDIDGIPYGVTILDFNEYWSDKKTLLVKRITKLLNVSKNEALRVLQYIK